MEFSSILFLCFFFPLFFIIYYLLPERYKNKWLLFGSIFFLIYGRDSFIWYFLLITGITYFILMKLNQLPKKISKKKIVTWIILIEGLIWFLFIKDTKNLIYPICYTVILLSNIGSLLDFYRNKRKTPSLFYYVLYMSCFSKLLFGPIVSFYEVEEELKFRKVDKEKVAKGCFLFLKGIFINVLLVGMLSEFIYELYEIESILATWLLLLATLLQISLFMMSYSDMSTGLSTMLGFSWKQETNYPLCLYKMKYFFSSWHASLATWWNQNLLLFQKKLPFLVHMLLFMIVMSLCYGCNKQVILWFLLIGMGIFLEEIISKKSSKFVLYVSHFICLLLSTSVLIQENILKTINQLFNFTAFPFSTASTIYYFSSYLIILILSLLISCKVIKKITDKCSNHIWYHIIRNIGYILLLMLTFIVLMTKTPHSIWWIRI